MKKHVSTLSLIALGLLAVWQYWTDSHPASSTSHQEKTISSVNSQPKPQSQPIPSESSQPQVTHETPKSAVKNADVFVDYDVVMSDDKFGQNKKAPVDYYMLALSWSPGFCEYQREKYGEIPASSQYQCAGDRTFGWVVHGLWPQNANAESVEEHPRFCQGDLPALQPAVIEPYLSMSPGAKLLQGEWEKHGSCAFHSAEQYFAKEQALFNSLRLPDQYLEKNALFRWMKQNNPQLKNAYLGASQNELFICYNKQWQVIDCQRK